MQLLTRSETVRLLREHGLATRKAAGQNLLVDPNVVRRIVAAASLTDGDMVLEIGPGLGALTRGLIDVAGRVIAVEIDAGFVAALHATMGWVENLEIVHADAMDLEMYELLAPEHARVVANLPYNVATPLLFRLLDCDHVLDLLLMVQREVGERWAAVAGDELYGGVSLKLALLAQVHVEFRVPATVFLPPPNVESVMVRVVRRADAPAGDDRRRLLAIIDAAFATRRKTLRNTLAALAGGAVAAEAALRRAGLDPALRAERLTPEDVRRLADVLPSVRDQGPGQS